MAIVQYGSTNTTAQIVPGLTVQIVSPRITQLNGVPTDRIAVVGTASFGPLNTPVAISSMADYERYFGKINARTYDMGTQVATAIQQGARNFVCVRVAKASAAAATATVQATGLTLTSKFTGTQGNNIKITLSAGSKASTFKAVISIPGMGLDETFNNIGGSANAFWVNLAAAINSGTALRGPSNLVVAVAGALTAAPTLGSTSLTGGNDGEAAIAETDIVGDSATRTGMYALSDTGAAIGVLADCNASASLSSMVTFGLAQAIYWVASGPSGQTVAQAKTAKETAGLDSYVVKLLMGDYCFWQDPTNAVVRLVSPAGFVAGRLANLSPENSSLNKPIYNIIGTQKSGLDAQSITAYSQAELEILGQAGIDVVTNPAPGGAYWAVRLGVNSSSNPADNGDNYTRLTNYFAVTVNTGFGREVGGVITPDVMKNVETSLNDMLSRAVGQRLLSVGPDGSLPYRVVCNASNNPTSRTQAGYLQADVQIRFGAILKNFIVNVEGGQTVTVIN